MTIIYVTENKTKCYAVTFQNKDGLKYRNLKIFLKIKILYTKLILWKHFLAKVNYVI